MKIPNQNKIITIIVIVIIGLLITPYTTLNVRRLDTGQVFIEKNMLIDKTFKMRWIHSVELTPWEELFEITDEMIYLESTRFQSFGAGVPDAVGTHTETSDGYVTYSGIHQKMPSLSYGISPIAKHELTIGTKSPTVYKLYELLPADTAISFEVVTKPLITRLFK